MLRAVSHARGGAPAEGGEGGARCNGRCDARCTMRCMMRCTMRCTTQQARLRKRGLGSEAASASACGFVPGEGLRCAGAGAGTLTLARPRQQARQWEGTCVTAAAWLGSAPQLLKWTTMTASTTKVSPMCEKLQPYAFEVAAQCVHPLPLQRAAPVCTTQVPRGGWEGALKEMFAVARQRGGAMGGGAAGCDLSSGCVNHTHAVCGGSKGVEGGSRARHQALHDSTRGKGRRATDGRSKEGRSNGRSNARGRGAMAAGRSNGGRARGRAAGGAGTGAARGRGRGRGTVSPRPRAKGRGSAMPVTETSTAGVYVTDAGVYVTRTA